MPSPISRLKIALIADELTHACLKRECRVMPITPWNAEAVLGLWRPDILLVESSWKGWLQTWKYRMASYPDHPERNNKAVRRVVQLARARSIKTAFWNREDGVHFDRFIESARLFDFVFTVDANRVPCYREICGPDVPVEVLMFAAQPAIHFPKPEKVHRRACFVGSYSTNIHPDRRAWQNQIFEAASEIGLTVYDRNWFRSGAHYRFPARPWIKVRERVPHRQTAGIYRSYIANINVNTVTDSQTAFSRRLVEILACGSLAVTNPTPAVDKHFADYCKVVKDEEEARELFRRLARDGLSAREAEMVRAGAEHVRKHHTWRHRLEQLVAATGV